MNRTNACENKMSMTLAVAIAAAGTALGAEWPDVDFGADFRIRQEIMGNLPGLPGDAYSQTPSVRAQSRNQLRMRPRVWMSLESGPFSLYTRLTDEFRFYPTLDTPRRSQPYHFPDEVFLDNLYVEGRGLEWDALSAAGVTAAAQYLHRT